MRIASVGHLLLAVAFISLGILGLVHGKFAPLWDPVPDGLPARQLLLYLTVFVSLASGLGLLFERTSTLAARLLFGALALWLLFFRVPNLVQVHNFDAFWPFFETGVMVSAAWVLYTWFAADSDRDRLDFVTGKNGLRIARALYGLAMIFFGFGHFKYLDNTISLIPHWLPWHPFWARFTGCALIAAGVGILIGVYARLAAALSTFELGLFLFLVWIPIVAAGSKDAFQWSETILSAVLLTGSWVVAESYRGTSWFAVRTPA
ncbi:MAG TPA: DoxX family membrane protein [Terracidiphilus sp.]|jgi:uncharacterized membrane protein|nr:DoxX family membrane protein [Terracidiphilus sp.]